jgi:hypothetical protein
MEVWGISCPTEEVSVEIGGTGLPAGAGAVLLVSRYFSTSSLVMRPFKPVPSTRLASILFAANRFFTRGDKIFTDVEDLTVSATGCLFVSIGGKTSFTWGSFISAGGGAIGSLAGAGFFSVEAPDSIASPGLPIQAMVEPTLTLESFAATIFKRVPDAGLGISVVTFSVSTSTITSSSLTASPSFFSQFTTVSSSTPSPMLGAKSLVAIIPPEKLPENEPDCSLSLQYTHYQKSTPR